MVGGCASMRGDCESEGMTTISIQLLGKVEMGPGHS